MTKNEFYTAVINGNITEEVKEKAAELREALTKVSAKEMEKRSANSSMLAKIVSEILTDQPMTAAEIAEAVEATPQKISSLMSRAPEGMFEVMEVKNAKGNKVKGFYVPKAE